MSEEQRGRRQIRRNAIILGLVALGFYVAFTTMGVLGVKP